MNKITPRKVVEGVGVVGIIVSLIFVGLQMRQASEIAIAGQYQERTAIAIEYWNTQLQLDISMHRIGNAVAEDWMVFPGLDKGLDATEVGRTVISVYRLLSLFDNLHFQYVSGLLLEPDWIPYREQLMRNLRAPEAQFVVSRYSNGRWRPSFLELCLNLIEVVKNENTAST